MQAALGRVNGHSAVKVQPPARGTAGRKRRTPTSVALASCLAVLVAAAQVGLAAAQACAAGKYLAATGSTVCTDCVAGTFSAVVGATVASTCATCVAGKYAAASASTVCTNFPAGKISAAGATACSNCHDARISDMRASVCVHMSTNDTFVGCGRLSVSPDVKRIERRSTYVGGRRRNRESKS